MQAPIRFTSAIPGAIAQRQGDQQALQQFFDRNKVEKARMEQIKSLKQLAKGYGASAAQVESSSYGELQGFVQRMELERADKTRAEQTRLRELQMQQSRQAMELASEQRDWLREKRAAGQDLSRFMVDPPKPKAIPSGQFSQSDGRAIPTLPGGFAQRVVPEQGFTPTGPSINVATGEVTAGTPPIAQPLPERFRALLNSNLSDEAKAQGIAEMKAEAIAQQKLAAEQGSAALAKQIKVNEELRNQTGFAQEQGVMSFDGLTIGTGENASILQGKIGDKAEAIKAKEGLNNLNSILRDLDQLIALGYKRENSRVLSDDDKEKAAQLANRVRGQIREEILGPGTVTGPEFDRLAAQVPDPTAGFDLFSAQFGQEGSRLLEQVKADLIKKVKGKYAAYGVTTGGTANPANTRQLSTGKEVEIIFDPAE